MGNKLLLADDSITIQKVVGIIFANEDYELTVVDNGNAALEKAREILPDVLLVDALMPGKTGYEVCEAVRREPLLKQTPLLLMTGAFEPFDEDKARESGADDFISKPFESQHLIDKIKNLIELGKERAMAAPVEEPDVSVFSAAAEPVAETRGFMPGVTPAATTFSVPPVAEPDAFVATSASGLEEAVQGERVSLVEEAVEAAPEDDLWGIFELNEIEGEEPASFGVEEYALEPEEVAGIEAFSFEESSETGSVEPEAFAGESPQFGAQWETVEEQPFTFQEEEEAGGFAAVPFEEDVSSETGGDILAQEAAPMAMATASAEAATLPSADVWETPEESQVPPATAGMELLFAPEEEYVPAAAALASPSESTGVAAVSQIPAETAISEEQMAALISRISREVIEKIVWEVVPDLAETLIKEEIRKMKEGC